MPRFPLILMSGLVALGVVVSAPSAKPCSRELWPTSLEKVFVGRIQDWTESVSNKFRSFPRGQARSGLAGPGSLEWKSKYGSLVLTGYNLGTHEGVNEKGLAGRLLFFDGTDFGTRDPKRPGLSASLWVQYFLDNFSTVKESVDFLTENDLQIVPLVFPNGQPSALHISLEDRTGGSAVVEYIKGHAKVHSGREHRVVTNAPAFDQQLENLKQYKPFGGDRPLPGATDPKSRFVRATYYQARLPKPKSEQEAVAHLLGVMRNVSAPFEAEDKAGPDYSPTQWRTVTNLTDGVYYFESSARLKLIWLRLGGVDLTQGKLEREFDPEGGQDVTGDVTEFLKPAKAFEFKAR